MTGTTLALVRHGRTEWNRDGRLQGSSDVHLDDVGRGQARSAARLLAAGDWAAVVSSPLRRAHETATIIGEQLGIGASEVASELVERTYGQAEGLTRDAALQRWPDGMFPGLESIESVTARAITAFADLQRRHPGGRVVVVAHGALIRAALEKLSGGAVPRIVNGAVSTVRSTGDGWSVDTVNVLEA